MKLDPKTQVALVQPEVHQPGAITRADSFEDPLETVACLLLAPAMFQRQGNREGTRHSFSPVEGGKGDGATECGGVAGDEKWLVVFTVDGISGELGPVLLELAA